MDPQGWAVGPGNIIAAHIRSYCEVGLKIENRFDEKVPKFHFFGVLLIFYGTERPAKVAVIHRFPQIFF
jgi:hypothetical protein